MSYISVSDSTYAIAGITVKGSPYYKATAVNESRLPNYEVAQDVSGTGASTVVLRSHPFVPRQPKPSLKDEFPQREALHAKLIIAKEMADQLVVCAQRGDPVELANAGYSLQKVLDELWKMRFLREPDWGDLVNLLQTVLKKQEFERFSPENCSAVKRFVEECLASGTTDGDEQRLGVRLLRKAGLDPWKALTSIGNPE